MNIKDKISYEIDQIKGQRHQFIIINGETQTKEIIEGSIKELEIPIININLEVSKIIKDVPINKRPRQISNILRDMLNQYHNEIVYFDQIEYLFDIELQQDPIRLFESLSGNTVLLVWWPGKIENDNLIYATSDHPEYFFKQGYKEHILNL